MILQKYSAALTSIAIVVLTALIAIPSGQLGAVSALQIAAIGAAAVATYFVPLANGKWKGRIKTGVAVAGAVITAALPFANAGGFASIKPVQIAIIVLAALNVLGVEIGVNIRTDAATLRPDIDATPIDTTADQSEIVAPLDEDDVADTSVNAQNEEAEDSEADAPDEEGDTVLAANP